MGLDVKVKEIARRELITIDEESPVLRAAELMVKNDIGSVVVSRSGEPVGILTERDILKKVVALGRNPGEVRTKEIMSSPPITIESEKALREAVDLMNRRRIRRLLVTEGGKIVGIFTQRDVLALNRICLYCAKEIKPALESLGGGEPYMECECGAKYHLTCVKTVVYCLDCGARIATEVIYPEPSETMSG